VVVGEYCDVSKLSSVESLKQQVYSNPALGEVAFLFANAGMSRAASGSVIEPSMEDWERTFAVNVYGVVHCLKSFVPAMQAQRTDCAVVTTSSYAGLLNASPGGFGSDVCYTASKHAVTIITEALAHELRLQPRNQVSVHCLFPAGVKTNFLRNSEAAMFQGVDEGPERARREEGIAKSRNVPLITRKGLTPDELVQVLYDGMKEGKFYIRAYDHENNFDVLGAVIMERVLSVRPPSAVSSRPETSSSSGSRSPWSTRSALAAKRQHHHHSKL